MTEPRARVAKNLGKANFAEKDLSMFLTAHGDSPTPLPETVKILDEIATEYIQGLSFEATRLAHHAGRQKVKFEDFQFAMRRNPELLGKVQEMLDKKKELLVARKAFDPEDDVAAATDEAAAAGEKIGPAGKRKRLDRAAVAGAKRKAAAMAAMAAESGGKGVGSQVSAGNAGNAGGKTGGGDDLADMDDDEDVNSAVTGGKKRKMVGWVDTKRAAVGNA